MKRYLKNKTVYRLYTEDKNRDATMKLIGTQFANFTTSLGSCYWHGQKEYTIVIEIVDDGQCKNMLKRIKALVSGIKALNSQEEILLAVSKADIRFLN